MLFLALAVFIALPHSLCSLIMALNMTSYNAGRQNAKPTSPLTMMAGIVSSNSTCKQAHDIARIGRTGDMKLIKDKETFEFDHPGFSLCLAGVVPSLSLSRLSERLCLIKDDERCNSFSTCLTDE